MDSNLSSIYCVFALQYGLKDAAFSQLGLLTHLLKIFKGRFIPYPTIEAV